MYVLSLNAVNVQNIIARNNAVTIEVMNSGELAPATLNPFASANSSMNASLTVMGMPRKSKGISAVMAALLFDVSTAVQAVTWSFLYFFRLNA